MKIDVCIVTKSPASAKHIIDRLRAADFVNDIIIETSKPLGLARMRAIQQVSTEWAAFIDDDIIIQNLEKWFDVMKSYITPDTGAIEGIALDIGLGKKWDETINRFRLSTMHKPIKFPRSKWSRGYTHNTLVRMNAVRDWKPSSNKLEAFEDLELTRHVQAKGYDWLQVPVVVFHPKSWRGILRNAMWHGKTLHYSKLFTEREKVFHEANWMLGLFRCLVDPRLKMPSRMRVRTVFGMFFEILSFILGYVYK